MYGGVAREIRITEADKRDVLKIMKEWVESSLTVLEAEFPAWHLLNCFDVFQLASGNSASKKRATESDTALAKLAKVFEVDEAALKSQYLSVLLTAQALQRKGGLDNRSAWAETLNRLQKTSALRTKYPVDALKQVIAAFVAWTAASSGCEQMFSHLKRSPAELASSRGDTDRRLAVIIVSDPQFDNEIVERAQKLYGKLLRSGRARTAKRQPRINCRREGAEKPESKRSWIRARKKAVDAAAEEHAQLCTPERRPAVELPESLAKEVAKQKAQEKKRKAEAFLEGSLLAKEVTADVRLEAEKRLKIEESNDRNRHKQYVTITAAAQLAAKPQSRQWALKDLPSSVFLLEPFADRIFLERRLQASGVDTFAQDVKAAKLLIGPESVEAVSRTHRLLASVFGCTLLSASVLRGTGGYKIAFQAGVEEKARVFCTNSFKTEAPALTLVVREACSRGQGWTATSFEEARKKDGWKWGLVLRGKTEEIAPAPGRCKTNQTLSGDDLVTWATREFMLAGKSAWIPKK